MKRTELKRKTPLRAKKVSLKRTPLNRGKKRLRCMSKATAEKHRGKDGIDAWRIEYKAAHQCCALAAVIVTIVPLPGHGYVNFAEPSELHEITAGKNRRRALQEPAALLHLSHAAHRIMQSWAIEKQLAVKLMADPLEFDLDKINELLAPKGCQNPPKAITLDMVTKYLRLDAVDLESHT